MFEQDLELVAATSRGHIGLRNQFPHPPPLQHVTLAAPLHRSFTTPFAQPRPWYPPLRGVTPTSPSHNVRHPTFVHMGPILAVPMHNSPMTTLQDLPNELVFIILSSLPIWALRVISWSPQWSDVVYSILARRPLELYLSWHLPAEETQVMMRRFRAILVRSGALHIVAPSHWIPADLDFSVPNSEFDSALAWFLRHGYTKQREDVTAHNHRELQREDWVLAPEDADMYWDLPRVRYDANSCVRRVVSLVETAHGPPQKRINVLQSLSDSAVAPICFFPSTLAMNFVTGDGAVCLYPTHVQRNIGVLNHPLDPPLHAIDPHVWPSLCKHQDRGYIFRAPDAPDVRHSSERRHWDDLHSVFMPFDRRHPVTVTPNLDWNTGDRIYKARGYYDVPPVVGVTQDAEVVYYQDALRKPVFLSDVPDSDIVCEGSEVLDSSDEELDDPE